MVFVVPYKITVEEFTNLEVPMKQGAEGKVIGNILVGDEYWNSYPRTPVEILRILYGGNESVPGGFYPNGADGSIAKSYLKTRL